MEINAALHCSQKKERTRQSNPYYSAIIFHPNRRR